MSSNKYFGGKLSLIQELTKAKSLRELTYKLHLLIIILLVLQNLFITIFRYQYYPFFITLINISEISVYTLSILLFAKKHYSASILVAAYLIPVIFSVCLFSIPVITFTSCLWFLLAFEFIYIILIDKNSSRFMYVAFCAVIFLIPGVLTTYKTAPAIIIKFTQLATLTSVPLLLAIFIENQDKKLQQLNRELKRKYIEKENDAKRLDERNSELVVFSHIMSHDLKAPLVTIKGFSELLIKGLEKKEANSNELKYSNFILDLSGSMSDLINGLLTYSKIEMNDYSLEVVDLHEVIEQLIPLFKFDIEHKKVKIEIDNLPNIKGNSDIIKTVFQNLISNSIKYQPKDLTDHQPQINIWSEEDQLNIYVFLKDNGIGIEEDYVENLFTPFKRFHTDSAYKGTGLGMSICQKIMKKHKGNIELENTSEKGSTFKLTFPK